LSDKALYYQDGNLLYTQENSNYLPTINLKVGIGVWDSSQASTLTLDWVLVRKYSDPEPSVSSFGSEETTVTKNLTTSLSIYLSTDKKSTSFRKTEESISPEFLYSKKSTSFRKTEESISPEFLYSKIQNLMKSTSEEFSISTLATRREILIKSILANMGISDYTNKVSIYVKNPDTEITLSEIVERAVSLNRAIAQSITSFWTTTTYQKLVKGYQDVYQTITLSTTTDRMLNIQRSSQNTLTLTFFTTRAREFVKTIYHTLTLEINVPEIFELNREISETANIQTILKRIFNLFRQPHLEEQITTSISREAEYERESYTDIELSLKSTKAIIVIVGEYNITVYTQEYAPGDKVYIYAMIPELTRSPPITIYYPNMTELIEDTMNYFENNIFYYTLTAPNIKGDYLIEVTAGNSTAINTFRVSSAYIEGGGVGIEIYTTGDYLYYPGTTAKIPFTIISKTNGEPVDYDSIKITIYNPNMSNIAERTTANKISQGIYYINYNISSLADYGVYPIVINATSGSYYTTRLTSFKVLPAGPLDVSITPLKTEVQQGEDLPVKLRIKNLGEGRTITYTYRIYSANSTYYTETSTLTLNRYEDKQLIKTIPLPITADTGIATLELNVSYSTSEPSIYNTNFVTISYSPRGYTPKILTTTFNLTPEKQYLTILRNNNTIFSGIIHDKDTMQLSEGKYKFIFTAENYFKKTAEIYLDRDLTITSKLSSTFFQIPVLLAGNIYKFILLLLILACILVFFKFIRV